MRHSPTGFAATCGLLIAMNSIDRLIWLLTRSLNQLCDFVKRNGHGVVWCCLAHTSFVLIYVRCRLISVLSISVITLCQVISVRSILCFLIILAARTADALDIIANYKLFSALENIILTHITAKLLHGELVSFVMKLLKLKIFACGRLINTLLNAEK